MVPEDNSLEEVSASPVSTSQEVIPVNPSGTPVAPSLAPATQPVRGHFSVFKFNKTAFLVTSLAVFFIVLVGIGGLLLSSKKNNTTNSKQPSPANYAVSSVPLQGLNTNTTELQVGQADHLAVNGQLQVNSTLVLSPTSAPSSPVTGQVYYDQKTNQPYFYNGSQFISLEPASVPQHVTSIGGVSGDISVGNGLQVTGSQISISPSLSPLLNGNKFSSLSSGTTNLVVTNDGNGNYSLSDNSVVGSGSIGQIALYTGSSTISGSILSQSGTTLTDSGNLTVTGTVSTNTVSSNGGNLSLSAGNNSISFTDGGRTFVFPAGGGSSQTICTTGISCAAGGGTAVLLQPGTAQVDTGSGSSIFITNNGGGNLLELQSLGADKFVVNNSGSVNVAGGLEVTDNIATNLALQSQTLSVAGGDFTVNASGNIVTSGIATIQGAGGLSLGVAGTTNGSLVLNNSSNGNETILQGLAPTGQNQTITIPASDVANDEVCLFHLGNCVGVGGYVTDGGGQQYYVAEFSNPAGTQVADSEIYDNGTSVGINTSTPNASYKLDVSGNVHASGSATIGTGLTVSTGGLTVGAGGITVTGNSTIAGTIASLTGITSSGTITFSGLNSTGVVHTNSSGQLSTGLVVLGTDTSGNYVSNLGALTGLTTTGNTGAGSTPTLSVTYGATAGTSVQGNTALTCPSGTGNLNGGGNTITLGAGGSCNSIGITSSPTFSGNLAVQGSGGITVGTSTAQGIISLGDGSNSNLSLIEAGAPSGTGNATYQLPSIPGGTSDTVCLLSLANCVGTGGGVSTSGGSQNYITKYNNGGATQITKSELYDNGTFVGLNTTTDSGQLSVVTSGTQTGFYLQGAATGSAPVEVIESGGSSGDLLELDNSSGMALAKIDNSGDLTAVGGTFSGNISQSGSTSFSTGNGGVSLNGSTSVTGANTFTTGSGNVTIGSLGAGIVQSSAGGLLSSSTIDRNSSLFINDLSVTNGGTGVGTFTTNGILFGNGTGNLQVTAAAGSSILVTSSGGTPSLSQTLPVAVQTNITETGALSVGSIASGFGTISTGNNISTSATIQGNVVNATGAGSSIELNGTSINTAGTLSNVAYLNASSQTFTGSNTFSGSGTALTVSNNAAVNGTLTAGTLSVTANGTVSGTLSVQGSSVTIGTPGSVAGSLDLANAGSSRVVILQGLGPTGTGNATVNIPTLAGGSTDTVCLETLANCVGTGGGIAGSGTAGQFTKFSSSSTVTSSSNLSESGAVVTDSGSLAIQGSAGLALGVAGPSGTTGSIVFNNSSNANTLTLESGSPAASFSLTLPSADGSNGDCLETNGAGVLSFQGCTGGAGGGVTSLDLLSGVLNIANSTGSGSTITINNAAADGTTKGIATFNSSNFSASAGIINTIQNISSSATPTFNGLTLTNALSVANGGTGATSFTANGILYGNGTGNLQVTAAAGSSILVTSSGGTPSLSQTLPVAVQTNITETGALSVGSIASGFGTISTGNNISTSAALQGGTLSIAGGDFTVDGSGNVVSAGTVSVQGNGGLTVGTSSVQGVIYLGDGTNTNLSVLEANVPSGTGNATYKLPSIAAGTSDTVCLYTLGNCVGTGGGITGSGSAGYIAKFSGTGTITDSNLSESGTTLTYAGNLLVNAGAGFSGNLIGLQVSGTNELTVNQAGNISAGTLNGQTISSAANFTGSLTVANSVNSTSGTIETNGVGRIDNSGNLENIGNFTSSGGTTFQTTGSNGFTFKPGTDNATAFQIQNSGGTSNLFVADTADSVIGIGMDPQASGATLQINGSLSATSSVSGASLGLNTTSVSNAAITKDTTVGAGGVTANDVVVLDSTGRAVDTSTKEDTRIYGVATATQAMAGNPVNVAISGDYQVTADTGAVNIGDQLVTSTTSGEVTVDNSATTGILGIALSSKSAGSAGLVSVMIRPVGGVTNPTVPGNLTIQGTGTSSFAGNLSVSGTINGQTISSAANFTGTLAVGSLGSSGSMLVCYNTSDQLSTCSASAGSGNYILNGTSVQSANFYVQSASSSEVAAVVEANASGSADILDLENGGGTKVVEVGNTGNFLIEPSSNSGNAFQVQNSTTGEVLQVSTNSQTDAQGGTDNGGVGINGASTSAGYALNVSGSLNATALYASGNLVCSSTGCVPVSGSNNYIQNGTSTQTANFNIQSSSTTSVAATIQGANTGSADLLDVKNGGGSTVFSLSSTGLLTATSSANITGSVTSNSTLQAGHGAAAQTTIGADASSNAAIQFGTNNDAEIYRSGVGQLVLKPSSGNDSTTAFEIQNAAGSATVFDTDTTDQTIGIGQLASAAYTLGVTGTINASSNIYVNGVAVCTVSTCSSSSGSGSYIQNSTSTQSANFNVQAATSGTVAGVLEANASGSADILDLKNGGGNAVVTFGNTGNTTIETSTTSNNAFQVENNSAASVLQVSTTSISDIQGGTDTGSIAVNGAALNAGYAVNIGGSLNATAVYANGQIVCTSSGCAPISGSTYYIQNGATTQTSANYDIQSANANYVVGVLKGALSQSADLFDLQNSSGSVLAGFTSAGALHAGNASGSNATGMNLVLAGGEGTGSGNGGNINFNTYAPGVGGSGNNTTPSTVLSLNGGNGAATFENSANSNSALLLENSSAGGVLQVSTNSQTDMAGGTDTGAVGINGASVTAGYALNVSGSINSSGDIYINGTAVCTITGCSPTAGSYIANSTTLQSAANFNIQSTSVSSATGVLEDLASQTADLLDFKNSSGAVVSEITSAGYLQGGNATGSNNPGTGLVLAGGQGTGTGSGGNITFQIATPSALSGSTANGLSTVATISGVNGSATFENSANSTAAFQIQNASGNDLFDADTTNSQVVVTGNESIGNLYGQTIFSDNFEGEGASGAGSGSNFTLWTTKPTNYASVSIQSSVVHSGNYAAEVNYTGGGTQSLAEFLAVPGNTTYLRAWFYVSSQTSTNATLLELFNGNNGTPTSWDIQRNTSNQVCIYYVTPNTRDCGGSFPLNTWEEVELQVTTGGSPVTNLWLNGTSVYSSTTDNNGTTSPEWLRLDQNADTMTYYMDDIAVTTARDSTSSSLNVSDTLSVQGSTTLNGAVTIQPAITNSSNQFQVLGNNGSQLFNVDAEHGTTTLDSTHTVVSPTYGGDNTTAFQIQNAEGATLLNANTTANTITINGALSISSVAAPATAPTTAVGSSGSLNSTYYYCVTYITALGSTPCGPASAGVTPANDKVSLTAIPVSTNGFVTGRGIYRTKAGGNSNGPFYLVTTLNNNTATTYTDNNSDGSLGGTVSSLNTTSYISNSQGWNGSEAFGIGATVNQGYATALGDDSLSYNDGVAVGYQADAGSTGSVALGDASDAGFLADALGSGANSSQGGVAIGDAAIVYDHYGIAIGYNATTNPAGGTDEIAIGANAETTSANQLVIGGSNSSGGYIQNAYIGSGVTDTSPVGITLHATGGSGTNIGGASLTLAGGIGTGTGNGGNITFQTAAPSATSGSSANSLNTVETLSGTNGAATFENSVNSSNAFQVQNAAGNDVLNIGTTSIANPSAPTLTSSGSGGSLGAATYYYELAAINANGTTLPVASSPASVIDSGSSSKNTLSWSAVTGATGYVVYRSTNDTTWSAVEVSGSPLVDNGSTYTFNTVSGLPSANTANGVATLNGALDLGYDANLVLSGTNSYISNPQGATDSEAFGLNASVVGSPYSLAVGEGASVTTPNDGNGTAIGASSSAGYEGVALGYDSVGGPTTSQATALGSFSNAGYLATAIGAGAEAEQNASIALGQGAIATNSDQLVIGSSGAYIQNAYIGSGVTATAPSNFTLNATGSSATTAAGATLGLSGGAGYTSSTGSAAGGVNIQGGNAGGSGNNNGGNITLAGGSATGSGTSGSVIVKDTQNSVSAFAIQNTSSAALLTGDTTDMRVDVGSNGTSTAQLYIGGNVPSAALASISISNASDSVVSGHYLYIISSAPTLYIYDISNPASPSLVSSLSLPSSGAQSLAIAGHYVYIVNYSSSQAFEVVDVSNPDAPTVVANVATTSNWANGITISGHYAYVAELYNVDVYDISNPANPVKTKDISLSANGDSIYSSGGYVYVTVSNNGTAGTVQIISTTTNSITGSLTLSGGTSGNTECGGNWGRHDIVVQDNYAYVANCGNKAIDVFSVDNPNVSGGTPVKTLSTTSIGTNVGPLALIAEDRYLYVALSTSGTSPSYFATYDISTPSSISQVGSAFSSGNVGVSIAVSGRYAYLTNQSAGTIQVFDLGGTYTQAIEAGSTETNTLQVDSDATISGNESVSGGLQVGQSTEIEGGLSVSTLQPASTSSAAGTNAPTVLNVSGGIGGNSSATTGVSGGTGAAISLQGGTGGNETGATGANTGGAGGSITITAGNGGNVTSSTGTAGSGGTLKLEGGAAGTGGSTTGSSGSVIVESNTTNSTTAFEVQNASGSNILNVDTSNSNITINSADNGQIEACSGTNWCTGSNTGYSARSSASNVIASGYIYSIGGTGGSGTAVQYSRIGTNGNLNAPVGCGANTWCTTTPLPGSGVVDGSAVYYNGYIYVLDGDTNNNSSTSQNTVYYGKVNSDGTISSWNTGNSTGLGARNGAESVVYNGYIYLIGGLTTGGATSPNIYYAKLNADGSNGNWSTTTDGLNTGVDSPSVDIANGYLYVIGGGAPTNAVQYGKITASGNISSAMTNSANTLPAARKGMGVAVINGYIYVIGGANGSGTYYANTFFAQLNSSTGGIGTWSCEGASGDCGTATPVNSTALPSARSWFGETDMSANGYIYVIGGANSSGNNATVYYTSTSRTEITGSLDLVGASGQNLAEGDTGGDLTAGNTDIVGTLTVQNAAIFSQGVGIDGNLGVGNQLAVGTVTTPDSIAQLEVSTNSAANVGEVLQGVASQTGDLLEFQNSAGTVLSEFTSAGALQGGNGSGTNNGTTSPQNLTLAGGEGTGTGSGGNIYLQVSKASATSGSTLNSQVTVLTVSGGSTNAGAVTFENAVNSTAGFQIQNASGTAMFTVDTTSNNKITLGSGTDFILSGSTAYISNPQGAYQGEAFGASAVTGQDGVALGYGANADSSATGGTALGANADVLGSAGTAVGNGADAGYYSTSLGSAADCEHSSCSGDTNNYDIAIGVNTSTGYQSSIAIGNGATATAANQLVIGGNYSGGSSSDTYIQNAYIGSGVTDIAPQNFTLHATGSAATSAGGATLGLTGGAGYTSSTGSAGGGVTVSGGSAGGSGNNNGGNVTIGGGSSTGSGAAGTVIIKNPQNSTTAFQVQNAAGTALVNADTTNSQLTVTGNTSVGNVSGDDIIFSDNFESGNLGLWTSPGNGTEVSVQSGTVHSGGFAAEATNASNNHSPANFGNFAASTVYLRAWVDVTSNSSTYYRLMELDDGGNGYEWAVERSSAGQLCLYNSGTSGTYCGGSFAMNGWHEVELQITTGGSPVTNLWLDGTNVYTSTSVSNGTFGVQDLYLGEDDQSNGTDYVDDLVLSTVRDSTASSLNVTDTLNVQGNATYKGELLLQPTTNSTSLFEVTGQNTSPIFNIDSVNDNTYSYNEHTILKPNYGGNSASTFQVQDTSGDSILTVSTNNYAGGWNAANAILDIAKDSGTGRSINAAGTINASGADYAEWIPWSGTQPPQGSIVSYGGSDYVVSSPFTAGFVGNDNYDPSDSILVTFAGQVPVLVTGPVNQGDILVNNGDGTAKAIDPSQATLGELLSKIAIAQETNTDSGVKLIQASVGTSSDEVADALQDQSSSFSNISVSGSADIANLNVSGMSTLSSLTVTGDATIQGTLTVSTLVVGSLEINGHIITTGGEPTAAAATAAGTNASVTITGTDTTGTIVINTGASPTAGDLANISFSNAYSGTPHIIISGQDGRSAASFIYPSNKSENGFELNMDNTPQANTSYTFDYFIAQ